MHGGRKVGMHRVHHGFVGMGAGDRKHLGKAILNAGCIGTEATGDNHSPLLREGFPDGL